MRMIVKMVIVIVAVIYSHLAIAAGPSNCPTTSQVNYLDSAALYGDQQQVSDLLLCGIDVNSQDVTGRTALMWAINGNHPEIVQLLLKQPSVKVNLPNNYGQDALMAVFQCNSASLQIADLLVAAGANLMTRDNNGNSDLLYAAVWGNMDKLQWIVKNFPAWAAGDKSILPEYVNATDLTGANAAWYAKAQEKQDVLAWLLSIGGKLPDLPTPTQPLQAPSGGCLL